LTATQQYTGTVNKTYSATTVTASPNPSVFGQQVTLSATVAANPSGAGTPTGTVSFSDGHILMGTASLSGGSASLSSMSLGIGSHTITAAYNGDSSFAESTGTIDVTVLPEASISTHPSDTTVDEGGNTAFAVTAAGVTTYQWQVNSGSGFTVITDGAPYSGATTATLTITNATAAMNGYQYRVIASGGQSVTSNAATLTVTSRPAAPTIVNTVAGNAMVRLTWNEVYGATGYKVFQSMTSGSYGAEVLTVSQSVYSADVTGLTNGTQYYFVVKTLKGSLESPFSNEVHATPHVPSPDTPVLLSAIAGDAHAMLTWQEVPGSIGYKVYQSETSGNYGSATATVAESVYSYDATGLTNGRMYYFIIKATNPGGDSVASNELSATPMTVAGAPTNVTAVAGSGQAIITFTAPMDNGGSPITGYEVIASPGNVVVTGATSPITVTGLTNGTSYTFTVKAINGVGRSASSTESNAITPRSSSSGGGGGNNAAPSPTTQSGTGASVLVNGREENAGSVSATTVNNQTVTTVAVDEKKLEEKLRAEGQGAVVTIPFSTKADVVVGELNGQMVKNMETQQAVLEIKKENAIYTLPAQQINIDAVSAQIGSAVALKDIKVNIQIAEPTAQTVKVVENAAIKGTFTIVAPPVEFKVNASYEGKTVDVSKFNAYVERTVAIPEGVDPKKITTGVVIEPDGTVRHVPTKVLQIAGKYYAIINSLTNSTYSVIWHPLEFQDVSKHWAKEAVNDMGSRMVISGVGNDMFEPDRDITRAEYSAIMVRALGLKAGVGNNPFSDVKADQWYTDYIKTAHEYKLISGYEDNTFRPMDKITREQAMAMTARAMKMTRLKVELGDGEAQKQLSQFNDWKESSEWAREDMAACIKIGMVSGRDKGSVAPKESITRAEVATIVRMLLKKSGLI
ncbi:S-layer homology domain-containing protein, partial [Heliomicrobium gestii]